MWHLQQNVLSPLVVKDNLIGQDVVISIKLLSINDIPAGQYFLVPKAIEHLSHVQLPNPDYVNPSLSIGVPFSSLHPHKSRSSLLANGPSSSSYKQLLVVFKLLVCSFLAHKLQMC